MSDLEFKRELSPDQLRDALSLLDRAAGAKPENLQVGDLSSAEGGDPGADQASTTMATQGQLLAIEDLQQRAKHLNLVAAAFFGLAIAATATLALLSWSERAPTPPSVSEIAHERLSNQPPGQSASSALPVAIPPLNQSPGGSERRPSTPEVPGSVGYPNRDNDQPAVRGAANRQCDPLCRSDGDSYLARDGAGSVGRTGEPKTKGGLVARAGGSSRGSEAAFFATSLAGSRGNQMFLVRMLVNLARLLRSQCTQ